MNSPAFDRSKSNFIKVLIMLGWLLLPLSHLKWLPELGTTRPLSSILFVLAFAAILLTEFRRGGQPISPRGVWNFANTHLRQMAGWQFLRCWAVMLILGVLSAAATYFYGSFFQALNRLLGYLLIFVFIYIALYSLQTYPIETIARWAVIGYMPVLLYAVFEALAILNVPWTISVVLFVRHWLVVPFLWVSRLSLLTTEPSFVGFQLLLLAALFPYVKEKPLRSGILALIVLALIFTQSATFIGLVIIYFVFLFLFTAKPRTLAGVAAAGGLAGVTAWVTYSLAPIIWNHILSPIRSLSIPRLDGLRVSMGIRWSYILNLIYVLIETRGLGLGIGQYGLYWKEIYLRHIDYKAFDIFGEVTNALNSSEYMRPWSVVLGIGADLGLIGMLLFFAFLIQIFRLARTPHERALIITSFFALLSAYPIVTPHVWLALALLGGRNLQLNYQRDQA